MSSPPEVDNWLEYDRFAVYGLGRSGRAACELLADRGKEVVASDLRQPEDFEGELDALPESVEFVFGENAPAGADAVVVSPGLEPRLEVFDELESREIPYFSEVDLAFDAASAPILAITGTDGKTTTTSLLGAMAEASRFPSTVGGNIGTPLSAVVDDVGEEGVVVAEVSAFQLWSCHQLRPAVAGYTNVAGDHLDYFDSRSDYIRSKRRLEQNSGPSDWVVYNLDDETVAEWSRETSARRAVYGLEVGGDEAELCVQRDGDRIVSREGGARRHLFDREELPLPGDHNVANAMCAAAMARAFGIEPSAIERAVGEFSPLPHRVEEVAEIEGVRFVNDSKATNVHSALAGLRSLEQGYVAIVGGVDKGLNLRPLCEELEERASGVVIIGAIGDRLQSELARTTEQTPMERAETLRDAVRRAFARAKRGEETDTVTLAPACSSFDMFESYTDRGEEFRSAVRELGANRPDAE